MATIDDIKPLFGGGGMPAPQRGLVSSALSTGFNEAGGMLGSAAQGFGQAIGSQGLADWGRGIAASQKAAADASRRPDLEQAPWYSPSGIAYNALKGLPQIGAAVLGGIGGAALAPEVGAAAGIGAAASMYPFVFGSNVEQAKAAHGDQLSDQDNATSALLAVPEAALAGWMPKNLSEVLRKGAGGDLSKRIFEGAWTNAAVQAPAMAVQTAVTQQAFTPDMPIPDRARQVVESALSGGVQGALLGGATHGLFPAKDPNKVKTTDLDKMTQGLIDKTPLDGEVRSPEEGAPIPAGSPEAGPGRTQLTDVAPPNYNSPPTAGFPQQPPAPNPYANRTIPQLIAMDQVAERQRAAMSPEAWAEDTDFQAKYALLKDALKRKQDHGLDAIGQTSLSPDIGEYGPPPQEFVPTPPAPPVPPAPPAFDPTPPHEFVEGSVPAANDAEKLGDMLFRETGHRGIAEPERRNEPGLSLDQVGISPSRLDAIDGLKRPGEPTYTSGVAGVAGNDMQLETLGKDANGKTVLRPPGSWVLDENTHKYTFVPLEGDRPSLEPGAPYSYEPPPRFDGTPLDSMTSLAQKLGDKRNRVPSQSGDIAADIADRLDKVAAGSGTKSEQAIFDHLGLRDEAGNAVPLDAALETAKDHLDLAKQDHAALLGSSDGTKAGEAVQYMKQKVDMLQRVQDVVEHRAEVEKTAQAAAEAQHAAEVARQARMDAMPDPVKGHMSALDNVKETSTNEGFRQRADELQKAMYDAAGPDGKTMPPKNLLDRATSLAHAAGELAQREADARAVPLKDDGHVDFTKLTATPATPIPPAVAAEGIINKLGLSEAQLRQQRLADRQRVLAEQERQARGNKPASGGSAVDPNRAVREDAARRDEAARQATDQARMADDGGMTGLPSYSRDAATAPIDHAMHQVIDAGGSGKDVLELAARSHEDPEMRDLATEMFRKNFDAKIEDAPAPPSKPGELQFGEHVAGYTPVTNTISIFNRAKLSVQNMLHEMVHAATAKAISRGGQYAREMTKLYEAAKKYAGEEGSAQYGLQSVHEFVSEAFTNPRFREFLKNARIDGPIGYLWRSIKNAAFKALGMPERVRTALHDVMDAGHGLMDEQLRLTDGRRVADEEAPRVGSVPDSEHMLMSFASDTARDLKNNAITFLRDHNKLTIGETVRRNLLGWLDADGLMGLYQHYYGGAMEKFYDLKKTFDSLRERSSQGVRSALSAMEEFRKAAPKSYKILCDIVNESQQIGSDPRKNWASQDPSLHKRKDAGIIAPLVDEHYRKYQAFVQNGGAKALEMIFSANRGTFYNNAAMILHEMGRIYKNAGLAGAENPADKFLGMSEIHSSPELQEQYWKGVFADLRDKAYTHVRAEEAQAARYPVGKDGELHPDAAKILDNVKSLKDAVGSLAQQEGRLGTPYLHLGRFGDHFVAFQLRKGVAGQGTEAGVELRPSEVSVSRLRQLMDDPKTGLRDIGISQAADSNHVYIRTQTADQAAAVERIAQQLQKEGHLYSSVDADGNRITSKISKGDRTKLTREMLRDMAPGWIQKLSDNMEANADTHGIDAVTREKMRNELHALWMDMIPDNSIHRVLETRQGVQGFNTDIIRNSAHRLQVGINAAAHLATTSRMYDALGEMRKRVESMKSDDRFSVADAIAAQQVASELATREARRPWSLKNTFFDHMLSLNHSYFLGLSPAYATELMSQIGTLMWPELSKKYGYTQSATAIFKAWRPTMQIMKAVMAGGHLTDATITVGDLRKAGVKPADIDFIMGAANRGEFELSGFTRALLGDSSGRLSTSKWSTAMKVSNALAINSETMPRILAAFAARDLHASDVRPGKAGLDHYVNEVITNSMMNWSSWTTPRHLGKMGFAGPLSPIMTKFMSFQIKMLEKLHRETITAFGNHADAVAKTMDHLTPAQQEAHAAEMKAESKRFLGAHTAMMVTLAGTMGLPFAGALVGLASNTANLLTNSDQYDLETSYRKGLTSIFGETAGSVIAHGLPRIANTDMSELGEGRLLPFSDFMTDKRKWEDSSKATAWRALGSPASMIGNIVRGGRDMWMGSTLNGMREMVPSSAKNLVDMYRMTTQGYVDKNGERLPIGEGRKGEADAMDILKQAVGLHSGDLADYEERARALEGYKERRQFLSSTIKVNLARALEHGNAEDIQKWRQRAMDFGAQHPLNNPMVDIGKYMGQRSLRQVQSRAFGTPLGTRLIDPRERYYATQ